MPIVVCDDHDGQNTVIYSRTRRAKKLPRSDYVPLCEAEGLSAIAGMFSVIIAKMGIDPVQPAPLTEHKLTAASSEIETVTRVGELLELAESLRPIFTASVTFAGT